MRFPIIFIIVTPVLFGIVFGQTDTTRVKKSKIADKKNEIIEQAKVQKPDVPVKVEVTRAAICQGIENREPKESASKFSNSVGKLYCFSHVTCSDKLLNVIHRWYYKYKLISSITLPVKGGNWRTYSYKTITPEMRGEWKVEIVNSENDEVLQLLKFLVE